MQVWRNLADGKQTSRICAVSRTKRHKCRDQTREWAGSDINSQATQALFASATLCTLLLLLLWLIIYSLIQVIRVCVLHRLGTVRWGMHQTYVSVFCWLSHISMFLMLLFIDPQSFMVPFCVTPPPFTPQLFVRVTSLVRRMRCASGPTNAAVDMDILEPAAILVSKHFLNSYQLWQIASMMNYLDPPSLTYPSMHLSCCHMHSEEHKRD